MSQDENIHLLGSLSLYEFLNLTFNLNDEVKNKIEDFALYIFNNNKFNFIRILDSLPICSNLEWLKFINLNRLNQKSFFKFLEIFVDSSVRSADSVYYFKEKIEKYLKQDSYYFMNINPTSEHPVYKISKYGIKLSDLSLNKLSQLIIKDEEISLNTPIHEGILNLFFNTSDLGMYTKNEVLNYLRKINENPQVLEAFLIYLVDKLNNEEESDVAILLLHVNKIIQHDNLKLEKFDKSYSLTSNFINNSTFYIEPHFYNIKSTIIEYLEDATYSILIIMAWLTDDDLLNILVKKQKEGVNIQIILDDNEDNNAAMKPYPLKYNKCKVTRDNQKNTNNKKKNYEHKKLCIIDFYTVIHGSYNWSDNANYNNEEICIIQNIEVAKKYVSMFIHEKKFLNDTRNTRYMDLSRSVIYPSINNDDDIDKFINNLIFDIEHKEMDIDEYFDMYY